MDCSAYGVVLDGSSQTDERQRAAKKDENFLGLVAAKLSGALTPA